MAVHIQSKGVDGEGYATEYIPPVTRGLTGIFFLNTSLAKCSNNYAEDKKDGLPVGVPVPAASYLTCKGVTNFIQTEIVETESMTMFMVERWLGTTLAPTVPPVSEINIAIGNYNNATGTDPTGIHMYHSLSDRIAGGAGYFDNGNNGLNRNVTVSIIIPDARQWALYSVNFGPSGVTLRDYTRNLKVTTAATGARNVSTRPVRVGSGNATQQSGLIDMAVAMTYNVELTLAEQDLVAADIRAYCARKGITV